MKNWFFLPVIIAICLSCEEKPKDIDDPGWENPNGQHSKQITIMSYNVRYCTPYQAEVSGTDINAIAAVINKGEPDVVFLQEVDRFTTRSGKVDQLAELSKKTKMLFTYFGKAQDYQGGEFGCAFLSRYDLTNPSTIFYPRVESQTNDRILIQATIRFNDQPITVACTHLGLYQEERDVQVPDIIKKLSASLYPVIFGGDLNAVPENSTVTTLLNNGFVKTNRLTTNTIPSDKPNRQLDYVMYRPADKFKVISHTVLPDKVSDHLAVVAVFELQ